jgi:sulfate adenylyltransferase subunit 1
MTMLRSAGAEPGRSTLRFLTAGSVDDGKSTLIGRLLFEGKAVLADQLDTLRRRAAGAPIDLSLLTDGLEAEREQGITIDVAYRYFTTPNRKFIIADAPGHEQYTRNMVTAAAGSDAAVVLVDITKLDTRAKPVGLLSQTRRHALLAKLLRVPGIVFAVNKLDASTDPGGDYQVVREALLDFARRAGMAVAGIVPISALLGQNVTQPLDASWYDGPTLLQVLENLPSARRDVAGPLLLPVQYVARDGGGTGNQPRTLWGRIARGRVRAGDVVELLPGGESAQVVEVRRAGDAVAVAEAGESAGVVLDRQLDVARGDWVSAPASVATRQQLAATVAWLDSEPAVVGRKYWVRHGHAWVQARILRIESRLDIDSLAATAAERLSVNEIGQVLIEVQRPLPIEPYEIDPIAGAMIMVDAASNRTSAAVLVSSRG